MVYIERQRKKVFEHAKPIDDTLREIEREILI